MNILRSTPQLHFLDSITYPEILIPEGMFSFISGKSGCGKSTYLKLLNKTLIPSFGEIYYQENNIKDLPVLTYRKDVLLVPQEIFLLDDTIKNNFIFYYGAREQKMLSDSKIQTFLEICCVDFPLTTKCTTLSGGERQRVFLAIFLSCIPHVLLLDEPTASLDIQTSFTLLSHIKSLCKKEHITVVCVSHNEDLIKQFSDNTIHLGENQL